MINSFNSLKKSLGFLTAAVLTVMEMGYSDKISESENKISENSVSESSVGEAETSENSANSDSEIIESEFLVGKKSAMGNGFINRKLNENFREHNEI